MHKNNRKRRRRGSGAEQSLSQTWSGMQKKYLSNRTRERKKELAVRMELLKYKFIQINPFIPLENIYFLTPVLLVEEIIVIKWGFKFYWYSPRDIFLVSFSVQYTIHYTVYYTVGPFHFRSKYELDPFHIISKDDECILLCAIKNILLPLHKFNILYSLGCHKSLPLCLKF